MGRGKCLHKLVVAIAIEEREKPGLLQGTELGPMDSILQGSRIQPIRIGVGCFSIDLSFIKTKFSVLQMF